MELAERVRAVANNPASPNSIGARLRARRWEIFLEHFPEIGEMRVLDLGGTSGNWLTAPVRPASLTLLNIEDEEAGVPWAKAVIGDACELPASLRSQTFDLVYSNSVIEHVGGHVRRLRMAETVHEAAAHHWVQTPYRYFPIEPHWLFPGFQFLPLLARAWVSQRWPFAWSHPTGSAAVDGVLDIELLSKTAMRHYFPTSRVIEERVAGLTKSLVAVR